jgi:hypothetical protein
MNPSLVGRSLNSTLDISDTFNPNLLRGKMVSLNLKSCKWFLPPSQDPRLSLNTEEPSVKIPETASPADLECIYLKMKAGHIVLGAIPVPEHTKVQDVLQAHLNMVKQQFPEPVVLDHIKAIVGGVNLDGGYSKIEILEALLEAEEVNPVTRKGGRNRPKVINLIREAITYVEEVYGGHSRVKREDFVPSNDGSSLREYPSAKVTGPKARSFLGLKE